MSKKHRKPLCDWINNLLLKIHDKYAALKGVGTNTGGLNSAVVRCVCVERWISALEPFDVIMSSPLCLPICFSSPLHFSVMSTLFLLNKGKHPIPDNRIFSSITCPWMDLLSFAGKREYTLVCVCVCVWGLNHSRRFRPEMGWVLLSSLNYLAHEGVCERTLTPVVTGDRRAECAVYYQSVSLSVFKCCLKKLVQHCAEIFTHPQFSKSDQRLVCLLWIQQQTSI